MRSAFDLPEPYSVMSPVHIPRGFTKAYIAGKVVEDLGAPDPRRAPRRSPVTTSCSIEGTGHAGVGRGDRAVERGSRRCSGRRR